MAQHDTSQPRLYARRWIMLFIVSALNFIFTILQMWQTSVTERVMQYYGIDNDLFVALTALVFNIGVVIMTPIVLVVIPRFGLRWSLILGALGLLLGSHLRLIAIWPTPLGFWLSFIGQTIAGLMNPFALNSISSVSALWFSENGRTLATATGQFSAFLGTGACFAIMPYTFTSPSRGTASIILGVQAICASILFLLTVLFVRDRPPTPPTLGAAKQVSEIATSTATPEGESKSLIQNDALVSNEVGQMSILQAIAECLKNLSFWIICTGYSCGFAATVAFTTLLQQIIGYRGYTEDDGGLFGMLIIFVGVLGAGFSGALVDITKRYKPILVIFGSLALGSFISLTTLLHFDKTVGLYAGMIVSSICLGFFGIAISPACIELAVELTFPVPAAISSTILNCVSILASVVLTIIMGVLELPPPEGKTFGDMRIAMYVGLGIFALSIFCLLLTRGDYRRLKYERAMKKQTAPISASDEATGMQDGVRSNGRENILATSRAKAYKIIADNDEILGYRLVWY